MEMVGEWILASENWGVFQSKKFQSKSYTHVYEKHERISGHKKGQVFQHLLGKPASLSILECQMEPSDIILALHLECQMEPSESLLALHLECRMEPSDSLLALHLEWWMGPPDSPLALLAILIKPLCWSFGDFVFSVNVSSMNSGTVTLHGNHFQTRF